MGIGVSGLGVACSETRQRESVISTHIACYADAANSEMDESRSWIKSGPSYQLGGMLCFGAGVLQKLQTVGKQTG
jgi:hypothetical protein